MQAISAECFLGFLQPCFQCSSKRGKVSPGRLVDSCPGVSIHQRGYLLHCFLPNTSLDFPLFWTLGYRICEFAVNKYHYTARTAECGHFPFTLHFVAKVTKKLLRIQVIPCLRNKSISSWVAKLPPVQRCLPSEHASTVRTPACMIRAPCAHLKGTEPAGSNELFLQVGLDWGSISVHVVTWNEKAEVRVDGHLT